MIAQSLPQLALQIELHIPHCKSHPLTQVVHADEHAFSHLDVHEELVQLIRQLFTHAPAESVPHMDLHPWFKQLEAQSF